MPHAHSQHGSNGAWPVVRDGRLCDIHIRRQGRDYFMLGPAGDTRELSFLPSGFPAKGSLPVLLGAGTGVALQAILDQLLDAYGPNFAFAVIDKEADVLAAGNLVQRFSSANILWITSTDPQEVTQQLTAWQQRNDGRAMHPLLNPFYLRLDRDFYRNLLTVCEASARINFWDKARYPKFAWKKKDWRKARVLLLTSTYFLMGEVCTACERLQLEHRLLTIPEGEVGQSAFVEQLLAVVIDFKPDFALTINHLGVDREGVLMDLLARLQLPLASWFVDNPHLILSLYANLVSPWAALFSWDADNIVSLQELGFSHVCWLPLGVDATRFSPQAKYARHDLHLPITWNREIAFVGNSMVSKVQARMHKSRIPDELLADYQEIAAGFTASPERSVRTYLTQSWPDKLAVFDALLTSEDRLNYETMLTWEATLQYRLSCISGIMPFAPLMIGDEGWYQLLAGYTGWHYRPEVNYYTELPFIYPCAAINFNCTSQQMKGAVNQRVFDVPATGAFLLTDYREQLTLLFEPDKEVICYTSPEQAQALAKDYLAHPQERASVTLAARERVLNEHTYEHRVRSIVETMYACYTQA